MGNCGLPFSGGGLKGKFQETHVVDSAVQTHPYIFPRISSPFIFLLFWGPLCFPLTRQNMFFAAVLIPAKICGCT